MKNKFLNNLVIFLVLFFGSSLAEELKINASVINYNDLKKTIIAEGNVNATDIKNNKFYSDYAKYDKKKGLFESVGKTKFITSEGYQVLGNDITYDSKNRIVFSDFKTKIIDKDGNHIFLEMFNYYVDTNIFFSKGAIKLEDTNNNNYNFSEIYIDESKKKMVGSDVKAYLNQESMKINKNNEPRFFANTLTISDQNKVFEKGIFTYCKNKENQKCPPWVLQSKKIEHNASNKTIYYNDAVLKIYDFPIFYFPKFSHPDPTVKRRSGFLVPNFSNNSTLGSGIGIPYFWNISNDKDLTLSPKLYFSENPLLLAEYRQDFNNSFLIVDSGYTQGFKKQTTKKSSGGRAHLFAKFNMDLSETENESTNFELNLQHASNDTYFKIYDVETTLAYNDINILENTLDFSHESEDLFFGANISAFENLTIEDRKKYEYLFPYLTFDKNLLVSEEYGVFDLSSKLQVRNYDVNKQTEFVVNDFKWKSNKWLNSFGLENSFEGLAKIVNYSAENTPEYKTEKTNSELSGALGFLSKLPLYKNDPTNQNIHSMTPKILLRYAPGHMRRIDDGKLKYANLFNLSKMNQIDVIENGLSAAIGFNYKKNKLDSNKAIGEEVFSFSAGQVVSEKENMDIPSSSSLDQRFSDLVGESNLKLNNKLDLNYNFALDQNYKTLNYNEIGADLDFEKTKFNISYLEEKNHIGDQEYIKTDLDIELSSSSQLGFSTRRNLLTNSAEFYNLSYSYLNDCLKAGIVFRREFYTDRDIEPENSLMFNISIVPFGDISSPSLTK
mgnify:CR=1 FL=1